MDPKQELSKFKTQIDTHLLTFLSSKEQEYAQISNFAELFFGCLKEYTLRGGKRLRASLVYHSYKMYAKDDSLDHEIIKTSVFMELLQSFLLIHDDIMDKDDLRRGGLTVHKAFEVLSKRNQFKEPKHFSRSMAILGGDLMNQLAYEIIANSKFPSKYKIKCIGKVSEFISYTIFGQVHDLLLEYHDRFTEQDILNVQHYKTSKYTYETPLVAGAILAGANDNDLALLTEFSIPAGIAFQIRDDILGMFGDEKKTGKSSFSDIKEGKKTLLILKALENGSESQRNIIDNYLGKKDLTAREAEKVRQVVIDTQSLAYSVDLCERYVRQAQAALDKIDKKGTEGWQFLHSITEYMIIRDM